MCPRAFSRCSNHWLVGTSAVLSLGLHSKSSPNIGRSQDQMTLGSLASPDPHKENPVWMAMPGTAMCWRPMAGNEGAIKAGLELASPRGLEHLGTPIPSHSGPSPCPSHCPGQHALRTPPAQLSPSSHSLIQRVTSCGYGWLSSVDPLACTGPRAVAIVLWRTGFEPTLPKFGSFSVTNLHPGLATYGPKPWETGWPHPRAPVSCCHHYSDVGAGTQQSQSPLLPSKATVTKAKLICALLCATVTASTLAFLLGRGPGTGSCPTHPQKPQPCPAPSSVGGGCNGGTRTTVCEAQAGLSPGTLGSWEVGWIGEPNLLKLGTWPGSGDPACWGGTGLRWGYPKPEHGTLS